MNEQLTVTAEFKINPETMSEFMTAAHKAVRLTKLETGCIAYDLHRDLTDPNSFLMYEIWASEAALTAHFKESHLREFLQTTADFLVEPIKLRRLQLVDLKT